MSTHSSSAAPRRNRLLYIAEAGLEYWISLLLTGSFFARLLTVNGVSDGAAGIITELTSFAFAAQLLSVFFHKRRGIKRFITRMHLLNQLFFVLLYFIPVIQVSTQVKTLLFVLLFLGGQLLANAVSPYKISWFMSFVEDKERGRFTAVKEMVSLAGGMLFSYSMGCISDYYKARGEDDLYFSLCGVTILVLAILHMLSIIGVRDKETDSQVDVHIPFLPAVKKTFTNKALLPLIGMAVLWNFSSKLSLAFYGVYQINDLGFDMRYAAFMEILRSVVRMSFSFLFGFLADKYSWRRMLRVCYILAAAGFFINIFTVPANGKVLFALYECFYGAAMAGINSGLMNIVFDYVEKDDRPAALGIQCAMQGIAGFVASLVGSVLLETVQNNGNRVFTFSLYGQQLLSGISFLLCVLLILYMSVVIKRLPSQISSTR